jgi:drug/metabolite transporter (DMT)-like permease
MTAEPVVATRPAGRLGALYPYALLSLCMLFWAGNWVIGRALRETMPPLAMTFWRWTVAALVLAPFALPRLKGKASALRRSWPVLLVLTMTGGAFYQAAAYFGLRHTETVNAVLLNAVSPLFIILAAWCFDGERASLRQLWGVALSCLGVLIILARGDIGRLMALRFSIGDLAILVMMPLWAVYTVMLRRRPAEVDSVALIFIIAAVGVPLLAPAYLFESLYIQAPPLTWSTIAAPLYTGCFASAAAYWCWNRGAELVGPNRAGFTTYLMPVFTTVLAVLLLDEQVHAFHVIGIITILFGVWLSTSRRRST